MAVPSVIGDLSTTASSNSPAGSDSPIEADNFLRAHAAFIAQLDANKAPKASPTFTGTVTADVLTTTGNTTLGNASTDTLNVGNGGIVKDASGNVGIGVTPSTWSGAGGPAVEVGVVGSAIVGNTSVMDLIHNAYYNSGWKYAATAAAAYYEVGNGTHRWFTAASGSANAEITFAERMQIDASGNVISNVSGSAPTLSANSQMVFNLTSNTNLRISVRGTDGVTRTANITLA
jgi:hypothetical protein